MTLSTLLAVPFIAFKGDLLTLAIVVVTLAVLTVVAFHDQSPDRPPDLTNAERRRRVDDVDDPRR